MPVSPVMIVHNNVALVEGPYGSDEREESLSLEVEMLDLRTFLFFTLPRVA